MQITRLHVIAVSNALRGFPQFENLAERGIQAEHSTRELYEWKLLISTEAITLFAILSFCFNLECSSLLATNTEIALATMINSPEIADPFSI